MAQAYFNGDLYYTRENSSAGQSPTANMEKWQALPIPAELADAIVLRAVASILEPTHNERATTLRQEANIARAEAINQTVQRDGEPHGLEVLN